MSSNRRKISNNICPSILFMLCFVAQELSRRIIRVELAKRFKKPSRSPPEVPSRGETCHKLYASNLAWKVRSSHLKEFFSAYSPVSARVVFDSPSGRSAGYGFISFATKEEAEAAMSSLEGKVLTINYFCFYLVEFLSDELTMVFS